MSDPLELTNLHNEIETLTHFRAFRETRDLTVRDRLVCKHLHLVHSVARRFSGMGESLDDLIQEGTIGLLKSVDVFDPERGVKFSTYACHLITSQIQHYLRDRGRLIRQPAWVQELNTKVTRVTEELVQELGRDPQLAEVAERLQLTEESVHNALAAKELNSVASLSAPTDNGTENNQVLSEKDKSLQHKLVTLQLPVEDRIVLEEAINNLKTLEQAVIRLFFYEDLNQSEIARQLGISINYSSYLLRRSITKIKTILEEQSKEEDATLNQREQDHLVPPTLDIPTYDRFTGLYSSIYLRARVAEEIARGRRYPTNFALMLAKVSGLYEDHDCFGTIITSIGQALRQSTRVIDLTSYLENEQFALLLPHTGREAKILGQRLCQHINNVIAPQYPQLPFMMHIGYAIFPKDGATVDTLFVRAEAALQTTLRNHSKTS